jgi:DNA-binding IclR family transcriptional regulator
MTGEHLPAPAVIFLQQHVTSLADLEVLLALMSFRERWCDAAVVGAHVGLSAEEARRILDRLVSASLVDIRLTDEVRYRFHPATPELEAGARATADLYRRKPAPVVRWVARQTRRNIAGAADSLLNKRRTCRDN